MPSSLRGGKADKAIQIKQKTKPSGLLPATLRLASRNDELCKGLILQTNMVTGTEIWLHQQGKYQEAIAAMDEGMAQLPSPPPEAATEATLGQLESPPNMQSKPASQPEKAPSEQEYKTAPSCHPALIAGSLEIAGDAATSTA